jgi:hypothetical protein
MFDVYAGTFALMSSWRTEEYSLGGIMALTARGSRRELTPENEQTGGLSPPRTSVSNQATQFL